MDPFPLRLKKLGIFGFFLYIGNMVSSLIQIILTGPAALVAIGAPIPIAVVVRNISENPIWMVGIMDGSEVGFRYPHYLPGISGPEPLPPPEGLPWCGVVAPLRLQDFCYLLPGEGFDPTDPREGRAYEPLRTFLNFRPPFPGSYEFRLTLSTESRHDEEWLGVVKYPGMDQVLNRLAKVPRVRVESNVLTIIVE